MARLSILTLLTLWACDPNPKDTDTDTGTDTDTDTDTGELAPLTLAQDDTPAWKIRYSSAIWTGTITEDGALATIDYSEYYDGEEPVCTATMRVTGSPLDGDCSGGCVDADWGFALTPELEESSGECLFQNVETAPLPELTDQIPWFAHFTDVVDMWGDHYDVLVAMGFYDETDSFGYNQLYCEEGGEVTCALWDPAGDLWYPAEVGVGETLGWTECGIDQGISSDTSFMTEDAEVGEVAMDTIDVWTFGARAGQVLTATVDSTSADAMPEIHLVAPDGCLLGQTFFDVLCSTGEKSCPSVEVTLPTAGLWSLVVGDMGGFTIDYRLAVQLQ